MLVFSSGFCLPISGDVREARAPKLLHVGRRPSRIAHPAVGDPGSKGRRVAWTTSFGFGGGRDRGRVRPARIGPPLHRRPAGVWMETPTVRCGIVQPAGRVAQWESARLTNERLLVRAQPCPFLVARS